MSSGRSGAFSRRFPTSFTDLEGLANGNNIPQAAPSSTSSGGNPTQRPLASTNPATTPHIVVTSTSLISHGGSGENLDVTNALFPPTGSGTTGEGLNAANFGSQSAPYAMALADRSALGLRQKRLRVKTGTISGGGAGLYWNDNSVPTAGHDHDSVVNFLPWEIAPVGYKIGANPSNDYPDIGTSDITATLHRYSGGTADLTLGNAIAEPAQLSGGSDPVVNRLVSTNPVQFQISVPHFQPANQQVYQKVNQTDPYFNGQETAAVDPNGAPLIADPLVFPMGYVTTRRIYIPDQNGFYRPGAAYRDVRVYTGVPPDYNTTMDTPTAEVGRVPSGFGIQTSSFAALKDANGVNTFDPYNLDFQEYYQPLAIHNAGNVNLLNVHLDQKQQLTRNGVTQSPTALSMFSDGVDSLSSIPGFDYGGAQTGPRLTTYPAANGTNVPADFFLIRSSLDSDLVAAYGHNPFIQNINNTNALGQPLLQVYPGATFHKAQVGSGQPSTLYVPDSPEGFTPGASLDVPPTNNPTHIRDTNNLDANGNALPFKTAPFVSVAVPFGTPVGSYSANVQLFEGLDPFGYSSIVTNTPGGSGTFTGLTAQIFPPRYGNAVGGIGTPTPVDAFGRMLDTAQTVKIPGGPTVSAMPNSSTFTALNVKVVEDRMTDGLTFGGVPMIDVFGAGLKDANGNATSVPDFAPAAFRDPTSGSLSMYWTSGRTLTGSTSPYNIWAANVPFVLNPAGNLTQQGYFLPSDPTQFWWKPFAPLALGGGTNSGLTIAQDTLNLNTIGAFLVNVQAPPLTAAYQNTLLFYPVTPSTGALGSVQPITNDPTQVKYGVKGLFTDTSFPSSAPNLWAFWTATTRGRTAIYYNSQDPTSKAWTPASGSSTPATLGLLPVPAGLTAVADPAPLLIFGNVLVNGTPTLQATIDVTYSGTAPGGNVDLYESRYQPDGAPTNPKPYQLDLVPFPAVTEILSPVTGSGWYQARDVAWSRTSQLNMFVNGVPILYDTANGNKPLFSRAVFDKATGLLALTGVQNRTVINSPSTSAFNAPANGTVTIYIDLATGRARFSAVPNAVVTAFFSPLARRLTDDSRADTLPTTFLDGTYKVNDAGTNANYVSAVAPLPADRRWYIWRKSGTGGASPSATIYYKTQRLTAYLPKAVDVTKTITLSLNGTAYSGPVDVQNIPAVLDQNGNIKYPASARLYFPIVSGAEGATITGSYTATDGTSVFTGVTGPDTVQWQDELRSNDAAVPSLNATTGLAAINPWHPRAAGHDRQREQRLCVPGPGCVQQRDYDEPG